MSDDFIRALDLPRPDVHLGIGAGSQAWQIARILEACEAVMAERRPDVVIVVGDVNSTVAGALAASTLGLPVAHVEAGLRSGDWTMPEERNRVLTDRVSSFLFTPSEDAVTNLRTEGLDESRIHFVGNVMIDSLDWMLPRLSVGEVLRKHAVEGRPFALVTLHRPSNVDRPDVLQGLLTAFGRIARRVPVLFPVHPRTRQRLQELNGAAPLDPGLAVLPPLDYSEFLALLSSASLVLTDSGGVQEEATVLGTPCLTLRENTERPITVRAGSNQVIGSDPEHVVDQAGCVLSSPRPPAVRPPLWDGRSADRIVRVLEEGLG